MGNNLSTNRTITNEKNTNAQYDKGYKRELSKKKELIHFLQKYVKAPWVMKLKPENITLCDKEFILQDYEKRDFLGFLEELAGRLSKLSPEEQADFVDWMKFVLRGKELSDEYIQNFVETMRKGGFNTMMVHGLELLFDRTAEEGRMAGHREGRKEGRKEGRVEGRKEGRKEGRVEGLRLLKHIAHDTEISPEIVAKEYNISLKEAIALLQRAEEH